MGLKINLDIDGDIHVPGGYVSIQNIVTKESSDNTCFDFLVYKNRQARINNLHNTINKTLKGEISHTDPFYIEHIAPLEEEIKTQLYAWSKSNKFQTAEDWTV